LGAQGLDLIELGSKSGVWLKLKLRESQMEKLSPGQKFLKIPKQAWITVAATEDGDVEESLAAELLKERAKGSKSKFEAYIDFLWQRDLAHHPIFWTEKEISWLAGFKEVQNAVLSLQELTQKRVDNLLEKLPTNTTEDDIRFALCLVESRAITTTAVPGAFVPILDHFRNDSSGDPAILVGDDGLASGPMVAVSLATLDPGSELRNCFDSVSNQELFTQYGEVLIRMEEDAMPEVNAYNEVPLPIRLRPEHWKGNSDGAKQAKVKLLQKRAGIDLSSEAFLRLPMDAMPSGRLLPLARFIQSPLQGTIGKEAACEELFNSLFKDCHPSLLGGSEQWEPVLVEAEAPQNAEELYIEVQARKMAMDWYEKLIGNYNRSSERIQQDIHDSVLKTSSSSSSSGDFQVELAEITKAFYKAKRKDGSTGKSRKSKECRVLSSSPSEGTVVVQFLENGVRHTIPEDWIVKGTSQGEPSQDSYDKRARGLLALALMACQGSVAEACCDLMMQVLQLGEGILGSQNKKERAQMVQEFQNAWQKEYDLSQSQS